MRSHHKVSKLEKKVKDIVLKTQTKIEEHKFLDTINYSQLTLGTTTTSFSALGQTGNVSAVINLCAIAQGTDINQRVGNEIKVLGVNLKAVVNEFGSARSVRTMLIQDTQQISDTSPSISDMFAYSAPNNYLLNIQNNKRFKILERSEIRYSYMGVYSGSNSPFTGGNPFPELNLFHKFKYPLRVRYNGSATSDVQKNALYLVILGSKECSDDTGANAGSTLYVPYMCRLKYIDG